MVGPGDDDESLNSISVLMIDWGVVINYMMMMSGNPKHSQINLLGVCLCRYQLDKKTGARD